MVGNKAGDLHFCRFHSAIHCPPECRGVRQTGIGIFECSYFTLARKPRPDDGGTKDQASAKAGAAAGFHDQERGG